MSVSFAQWRTAQRRQFDADLRRLRNARLPARSWPLGGKRWRLRPPWRRSTASIVALASLALGLAAWQAWEDMSASRLAIPAEPVIQADRVPAARVLIGPLVLDGDTFKVGGRSIRLEGIDAPELRQTCADGWKAGEEARRALAAIVAGRTPTCERVTTDVYGRTVAFCSVDGRDIGAMLVRSGMAFAYTTYSSRYVPDERRARAERLGIHARRCGDPAAWRASHR